MSALDLASTLAGAVVADLHAFYRQFHLKVYGHDDTPVHDALAVAYVIDPSLLGVETLKTEIDVTLGPCRGRTVVDLLGRDGAGSDIHVALEVRAEAFIEMLTSRVASLP